jgi:dimethylhistidine N-methyltransferase
MKEIFKKDVNEGLSKTSKTLPSKYFYDAIGDQIFVKIMHMPEYYLTRAEHEIFKNKTSEIITSLNIKKDIKFDIIELGAGDGTKTKLLLRDLVEKKYQFKYLPIDISKDALNNLKTSLNKEIKTLKVETKQGDYFHVLDDLKSHKNKKIILFLGSNIGNMSDEEAKQFLEKLGNTMHKDDIILLGTDLIKNKDIVLPAYSDESGVTKSFNLNLLTRINKELEANFDVDKFNHLATYTENEGIARSFLVSKEKQEVEIKSLQKSFLFDKDEKIHTEDSRKYNNEILEGLLANTSLKISSKLTDSNNYFADYILTKK